VASTPDTPAARSPWQKAWPLGLFVVSITSVLWPLLALPAAFFCFIGSLAWPRPARRAYERRWLLVVAALASGIGVVRFILTEAMPGIVGGGHRAVQQRAISRLREVLFAQDAMRRAGWIDPDGDGIGSAAFLTELCGGPPQRGQVELPTPVLSCGALVETALGPAARSGAYLFTVCLPSPSGGWTAEPGPSVGEERAEREFVAYAWPEPATPSDMIFFIDQHENILSAPALPQLSEGRARDGALPAPTCTAALGHEWRPWRDKKPRPGPLPGDTVAGR
jgi:hypothetical protein